MKRKGSRYLPVLTAAVMFFVLFYLVVKLYKNEGSGERFSGNPIIPGWYADPEVVIFDSTYWIFPTYSAPFDKQVFLDAFSSKDLVNWEKHERIIDTSIIAWADSAIWAPSAVCRDGQYFLFFSANDLQTRESVWWDSLRHPDGMVGGIGIAVASGPEGPYSDYLGRPLIGTVLHGAQPIDQFVFEEKGTYYIVYGGWGRCNLGMLNGEFTGLVPFENGELVREITPEGYVEGPVLFKKNGKFYMMWSEGGWTNDTYRVAYGISETLIGPFVRQGVILEKDADIATGAGHHSILNLPGTEEWYIVYHRRPIPNEGRDHRVTCIDRLYFDETGNILPVRMTFEGVKTVEL